MGTMIDLPEHDLSAYRAEAGGDDPGSPRGAVIVIQEIWGLADHIKDVTDRFAAQGYVAVAPDLLGHVGLSPEVGKELQALMARGDDAARSAAQPRLRDAMGAARAPEFAAWAVPALRAVVDSLVAEGHEGHVGVVGYCFGGSYSFALALAEPRLQGAVVYYGSFPDSGDPASIACPVLAFYGEDDHGITDGVPEHESRLAEAGVDYAARVYHGVGHAFFNDTNAQRYNADAAADAWARTLAFLDKHVARS